MVGKSDQSYKAAERYAHLFLLTPGAIDKFWCSSSRITAPLSQKIETGVSLCRLAYRRDVLKVSAASGRCIGGAADISGAGSQAILQARQEDINDLARVDCIGAAVEVHGHSVVLGCDQSCHHGFSQTQSHLHSERLVTAHRCTAQEEESRIKIPGCELTASEDSGTCCVGRRASWVRGDS